MKGIFHRLIAWIDRRRLDREMDDEIEAHLALAAADFQSRGLSPDAAARSARRQFGSVILTKDRERDARTFAWLDDLSRDFRYAIRQLQRSPTFTATAVLSLALALGPTAAVYNTADWLLHRSPEGVSDPSRLITVQLTERERPEVPNYGFSIAQYSALREMQDVFSDIAAYGKLPGVISNDAGADQIVLELVTGSLFPVLGLRAHVGRLLGPDDDAPGVPTVAVVSYALWQSQFGGDPAIVDKRIRLNGIWSRVVGVVPREFEGYRMDWNGPTGVWVPMSSAQALGYRNITVTPQSFFRIVGRLRDSVPVAIATQRAQLWLDQLPPLRTTSLTWKPNAIVLSSSDEMRIGKAERTSAQQFLGVLLIVCALVLLAACSNVANFLMGRIASRRRELALRTAIGASRKRLIRQLLTEAAVLGAIASFGGIAIGGVVSKLLSQLPYVYLHLSSRTTPLITPTADVRLLGAGLAFGMASVVFFGLLPALIGSYLNPLKDLKNASPQWTWHRIRLNTRQTLLILQVALSVTLAIVAGLYVRSFVRAMSVRSDYTNTESVLVARVVPTGMAPERGTAFYQELLSRLNDRPDVVSASVGWNPPFMGGSGTFSTPDQPDLTIRAGYTAAAPRFFETLGVPAIDGREFSGSEDEARNGLVINRVLAEHLWRRTNVTGESLLSGGNLKRVVGVVADDHCNDLLGDTGPCAWQAFPMGTSSGYLRIRTKGRPLAFVPTLRALVRELHPDAAIAEPSALDAFIAELRGTQRIAALASAGLATLGVLLLAIGCISLFQSMVKDSVREIAIRIALGAAPGRLAARIVAQGLVVTGGGLVLGLWTAHALAARIADQLYRTSPADVATFVVVSVALVIISVATIGSTALVATKTQPAAHLKSE